VASARRSPTSIAGRIRRLHFEVRREIEAEDLCEPDELDRLRSYLDKQLSQSAGRGRPPRQPPAAPPDGAAEPRLGLRPRRGPCSIRRGCRASSSTRCIRSRSSGEGHQFPRHGGDAAARQFRLDARPPDHGRRNLRRHPRAHAGALRRQGRDPRLHHAGMEGRAVARGVAPAGKPANPGRLNDLRHIIYKAADAPVAARAQESRLDDARGSAEGEYRRRGAELGLSTADGASRTAPDPDDDLGRCAGRRFNAVGECGQLPRAPPALGDRGDRDPLAGRADRDRHRP
jgi:hypothetical protein